MARRGENIHKRKDGRWEGRYIKARTPDRRICWGYIYGTTYAEVKQRLIHKKSEYSTHLFKKIERPSAVRPIKNQRDITVSWQYSSIITMEDTPELRLGVRCVLLQLFEHNEKAYRSAVQMMEECGKAAIVHPTGTGKSYIAFKLIEEHPADTIFWLSPSEYIFKTQIENLKRQAPDISLANVHFYTYAKLMCCATEELEAIAGLNPTYIILDEFHRVGAECWGASTLELLKLCPDAKILGLSATNIRYLDNNRDMAEELFDGHIASEMTLGEAIVRGILPAPKYVTTVYQYQKELTRYQNRIDNLRSAGIQDVNQKYLDALRRALEKADGLDKVFAHHITNRSGKYIVFCANKEHMDEMVSHVPEWFTGVNPDVAVYEAYSDDPGTDQAFADFKVDPSKRLKLLFCIDMLNEGVHVEGISGVILFRPTISPIMELIMQRAIEKIRKDMRT